MVISVGYRLALEHPCPAGLDDCEVVTRWAFDNREQLVAGFIISLAAGEFYWAAYLRGRDVDEDPYAVPLAAKHLAGLPPALVIWADATYCATKAGNMRNACGPTVST